VSRAWSLLVLTALLSACSPPVAARPGPALANTSWVVSHLGATATLATAQPTIEFGTAQVTGLASCNRYGAAFHHAGSQLSFSEMTLSAMACLDAGVMEQESAFAAALAKVAAVRSVAAGLELLDSSGKTLITLVAPPPTAPDRPLEGTTWLLDTIAVGETASSVAAGSQVSAQFADGHLTGKACNNYRASAEVSGAQLRIGPVMSTKMACHEPGVSAQEAQLFALLPAVTGFTITGDRLTLTTADGSSLGFLAQ